MKQATSILIAALCVFSGALAFAGTPLQPSIEGKYIEVRSCDVFTAACFANAEVGLTGEEAILAWDVTRGTHQGVQLDGLKVVAVLRASATLGDSSAIPYPARSIVFVDSNADAAQRDALVDLAKEYAGQLLDNVLRVEQVDISMVFDRQKTGFATLTAGDAVAIETRAMLHSDMNCGNDEAYYKPLTRIDNAVVAFTEHDMFTKHGLGVTWNESGRRSAWLGTFAK